MIYSNVRNLLVACSVGGAFLATPSESKAIFHWFGGGCCGGGQTTAMYAPTTAYYAPRTAYYAPTTAYYAPTTAYYAPTTAYYAPACNSCTTQVANYVPQTSYRPQYINTPVTTLRPVVGTDACTGCPVTVMRPVTSIVQQVQMVPVTSYRVVYSPVASSCCTTSYVAPAPTCCAPAAPAPTCCAPTTTVPMAPAPQSPATGSGEESMEQPALDLKVPLPQPGDEKTGTTANPTSTAPRLIDPSDRITARPMPRVGVSAVSLPQQARLRTPVQRVATPVAATPATTAPTMFDDGWRASSR